MLKSENNSRVKIKKINYEVFSYMIIISLFLFIGDDDRIFVTNISNSYKNLIIFITTGMFFCISLLFRYRKDLPIIALYSFLLLILYSVILLLSTSINNNWFGWLGNITSILLCALGIIIFSRINESGIRLILNKINLIISLIVFFQVVATSFFLLGKYSFTSQLYKMEFAIPIGASNAIAVFIVPIFVSVMLKSHKSRFDYICLCIIITILILTANRSGFFTILIISILYWKTIVSNISFKKSRLFTLMLICTSLFLVFIKYKEWIASFLYSRAGYDISINSFSSGRITILINKLNEIALKPFLGYGAGYESMYSSLTRAHNWIIEIIERSGVIGLLVYCIAIFLPMLVISQNKNKGETSTRLYSILVSILIISLFEPGLLSPRTDFIFGATMGMLISVYIRNHKVVRKLSELKEV